MDPNIACEDSHKTALYVSAEKGYSSIVSELMNRPDIDVNRVTSGRKTALYVSIEKNQLECTRHILRKCKQDDLYAQTSFGTTPLFVAQRQSNKEIIKLMMCVGKSADKDYEKNIVNLGRDMVVMGELPRFIQDVKTIRELNPSEFNGGIVRKELRNVQSRYMEGVA